MATLIEQGDLQFVFQHKIVLGNESRAAAEAVECAGEQGKFWPYHDKLMRNQKLPGGFSKSNLNAFAKDLGLDTAAFSTCVDSRKWADKVTRQDSEATRLGVRATPTFSLNGKQMEGLPPGTRLLQLVEEEIKRKGQ